MSLPVPQASSDYDGGSDILDADAPFDETEPFIVDPNDVINEVNMLMHDIRGSPTWQTFLTYLTEAYAAQVNSRGPIRNAIMLGGAPLAEISPEHTVRARERSVTQFAFFQCIAQQLGE
jgi:hypothetical protein